MQIFLFLLIQLIWASSYTLQKMALGEMPLGLVLIFRYGFATLIFFLCGFFWRGKQFSKKEWFLILAVGVLNFTGSPFFQLKALSLTYALDASIMITFEPLVMTLLAIFFLKEKLTARAAWAFFLATVGAILMSTAKGVSGGFEWTRVLGDFIFLGSLLCEGVNSITTRHLTQKYDPLRLISWMVLAGFSANLAGNFPLLTAANLQHISITGWSSVGFLALGCTCIGYGVWNVLLKKMPVHKVALSLFLQPIFGGFLAIVILKESVDFRSLIGITLILFALGFTFWGPSKAKQEYRLGAEPL